MPLIVKEKDSNQEECYFNHAALFMIMHIGEINGWTHRGEDLRRGKGTLFQC